MEQTGAFVTKVLPVLDIDCTICANNVENTVKTLSGVHSAVVNYDAKTLTVTFSPIQIGVKDIQAAVKAKGYDLVIEEENPEAIVEMLSRTRYRRFKWSTIGVWLFAILSGIIGTFFVDVPGGVSPYVYYQAGGILLFFILLSNWLEKRVQPAASSGIQAQRIVDKVNSLFVPVIVLLAIITFSCRLLFGGNGALSYALFSTVSLLVISCPYALALATPMAMETGMEKAAGKHILIKNGYALETLCRVDAVVLDKSGTLTEGVPKVVDSLWLSEPNICYLDILYTAELKSGHPLASAIIEWLENSGATSFRPDRFENMAGTGIRMDVKDVCYWVGNEALAGQSGADIPLAVRKRVKEMENNRMSVVYYGGNRELLAVLGVVDQIKLTSDLAVRELKNEAVEVHMLTEDSLAGTREVANELHIPFYEGEVSPGEREDYVKALQKAKKKVAVVGNGINDLLSLARADVSIVMDESADNAMDSAMVKLISSDPALIPEAIHISRRTMSVIRQNILFMFLYHLIAIPLAAGVLFPVDGLLLNPVVAATAMAFSSLLVVLNSLRLKYMK